MRCSVLEGRARQSGSGAAHYPKGAELAAKSDAPSHPVAEAVVCRVPSAQTCIRSRQRAGFGNDRRFQHPGQGGFEG